MMRSDVSFATAERLHTAFALHIECNLPFADAYHIAVMQAEGLHTIVTFDREFDRIPGITRIEPSGCYHVSVTF